MTKILLTNDYHGTETTVIPQPITTGRFAGLHKISRKVAQRCNRDLCGMAGCACGDTLGARGGNYVAIVNEDCDRNYIIDISASHIA